MTTPASFARRCVLTAMVALQQANRYPLSVPGMGTEWQQTVAEITERDAQVVIDALAKTGLLIDPEDIPVADSYSREEFGEPEAWGWNACRDYLLDLVAPSQPEPSTEKQSHPDAMAPSAHQSGVAE